MSKNDEANKIAKAAKADAIGMINRIHARPAGRNLSHLTKSENSNYEVRRSDAEKLVSKLHSGHDSNREIRKVVKSDESDAGRAISLMHSDSRFAGKTIPGNAGLVAKLASVLVEAVKHDYDSARAAKKALRKMIDG